MPDKPRKDRKSCFWCTHVTELPGSPIHSLGHSPNISGIEKALNWPQTWSYCSSFSPAGKAAFPRLFTHHLCHWNEYLTLSLLCYCCWGSLAFPLFQAVGGLNHLLEIIFSLCFLQRTSEWKVFKLGLKERPEWSGMYLNFETIP